MSEEQLTVESLAKVMADFIGHGMTEKCERHAQAIMPLLATIERDTAKTCRQLARMANEGDDAGDFITDKFNLGEKP